MAIRFCKGTIDNYEKFPNLSIDENFFAAAHKIFIDKKVEYITVCDGVKPIAFCYNDEKSDVHLHRVFVMQNSRQAMLRIRGIKKATIVSFNEIAYHLYQLFLKVGVDVYVKGDLWSQFIGNNCTVTDILGEGFFCEGNEGLGLNDLGYWKASFPHVEYVFWKELYEELNKCNKLYNMTMLKKDEINRLISDKICKAEPFMVARLGNTEAMIVQEYLCGALSQTWTQWLLNTSGFYLLPNDIISDNIEKYARLTLSSIVDCDVHLHCFESAINLINTQSRAGTHLADWYDLYVDFDEFSWIHALKGKRVLIVSSIGETIDVQYKKKDILFETQVLPNFNLIHYHMPETQFGNGCNGYSWFEMLNKIAFDISKIEFDVAIVAAGAYGYPLASLIKQMNKVVIELCSGLYPLFGIKNKTQQIIRRVSKYYNDNWIFPIETPPAQYEKIEKGAYWE